MMDNNRLFKYAFGSIVKHTRETADISIEWLAEKSAIPLDRLELIEAGDTDAGVVEIISIGLALAIRPATLVLRTGAFFDLLTEKSSIATYQEDRATQKENKLGND